MKSDLATPQGSLEIQMLVQGKLLPEFVAEAYLPLNHKLLEAGMVHFHAVILRVS